ncbi:MAG: LPS export ABC transporter periplasmic protein LptC [Bacteroidetes bacterium 37-13]|nr:MAG: LPS export ABC transporter periplasmic protein LptC [Bacteroidetes bacterium 37-13]
MVRQKPYPFCLNFFSAFQMKALLILCVTATLLSLFSSCKNDVDEAKKITLRTNTNIEKATNIEIVFSEQGVSQIVANAPELLRYAVEKPYMEFPKGIVLKFYSNKKVESTMTANYAIAQEGDKRMVARNNVVVINNKGETLNTEELIWDEAQEIIYSNAFVKISTKDEIIMGTGMTANQNFTNYVIKNISGIIKVKQTEL